AQKKGSTKNLGKDRYVVESVDGHRFINGVLEFQIKWEGYQEKTWTPEKEMQCHRLVEEYFKRNPNSII
ncbi:MAG: chromo domain-containing protein, partial [bacterium]